MGSWQGKSSSYPRTYHENLTGNYAIVDDAYDIYFLNPNGSNRDVNLPNPPSNQTVFGICNARYNDASNNYLLVKVGGASLMSIYAEQIFFFAYKGGAWHPASFGARSSTNAKSQGAHGGVAWNFGLAHGYQADGHDYGAAFGAYSDGHDRGAAVGYGAVGSSYGFAIGQSADNNGVKWAGAVGNNAEANNVGEIAYSADHLTTTKGWVSDLFYRDSHGATNPAAALPVYLCNETGEELAIPDNCSVAFQGQFTVIDGAGNKARYSIKGLISRFGGAGAVLDWSSVTADFEDVAGWACAPVANGNDLRFQFQGNDSTVINQTCYLTGHIRAVFSVKA